MTRQDLVARMGESWSYDGTRFLYMGSRDGYDHVTHRWADYRGQSGEREFRFRAGELSVGAPMAFTADESRWREFRPWRR
ncbi:MAG TPA: hypothetical protein VFG14_09400 [Chthoniobacteraceae bacterium]|nr:hypothetical protein [Chthoniobacteraceae bacterium]